MIGIVWIILLGAVTPVADAGHRSPLLVAPDDHQQSANGPARHTLDDDFNPCVLLTAEEASTLLGGPAAMRSVTGNDPAMTCEYATANREGRRAAITLDAFQSKKLAPTVSAKSHYLAVREATWHLATDDAADVKAVGGIGDDAFCVGGVLHLIEGSDTYIAIQVSGAPEGRPVEPTCGLREHSPALALSKSIAHIVLRRISSTERAGADPTGDTLSIQANTQAHWQGLRIGVGNIWRESYVGDDGSPAHGPTAGLWIARADDRAKATSSCWADPALLRLHHPRSVDRSRCGSARGVMRRGTEALTRRTFLPV